MSTTLFLTAIFPSVLSMRNIDISTKQIYLLTTLSKLVVKAYWWPQFQSVGKLAYKYVHGSMKHRYF